MNLLIIIPKKKCDLCYGSSKCALHFGNDNIEEQEPEVPMQSIFTINKEYRKLNSGQKKAMLNSLVEWANSEYVRLREEQE